MNYHNFVAKRVGKKYSINLEIPRCKKEDSDDHTDDNDNDHSDSDGNNDDDDGDSTSEKR